MALSLATNMKFDLSLRGLQVVFALIVMDTDGHSVHVFRPRTVLSHLDFGDFYLYHGVPNAWGFLLFCAGWTVLAAIFHLGASGTRFADRAWMGYVRVAVEAVALLSWFAGFIAVAVNIGTTTCPAELNGCDLLKAAVVFGALEWLLFMATAGMVAKLVFSTRRPSKTSKPSPAIEMGSGEVPPAYSS